MKKYLPLLGVTIVNVKCNNSEQNRTTVCTSQSSLIANSVTFNDKGELIFVNNTFNPEGEITAFKSYTETTPDMEVLNPSNLKNNDNEGIHIYKLKVGYSPSEYHCFKYNDKIYVIKEDQGRYLLPIVERGEQNSLKGNIDWVCVIGSDKDNDNKQNYFLLKKKFEDNKKNALVLNDFISKYKFKGKSEKMAITIIDEDKEKEKLNNKGKK